MRKRVVDLVVCPMDGEPLELRAWEENEMNLGEATRQRAERLGIDAATLAADINLGVLVNPRLRIFYPIVRGVPRMLTFPTAVGRTFVKEHAQRLGAELPGYSLPGADPMTGEEDVLRTFSTEWVDYDWNGEAYWGLKPSHMYRAMRFMLDLERRPIRGGRVLEVGIGIGGIADHVASTEECEMVGMDLGYAVDPAQRHFGSKNPFLHIVQASAFRPPFKEESFELVYSQGVLHHTFSTRVAVESIARLPRVGGRLYMWVYSRYDEERTLQRRLLMLMEQVIRPLCWRLPAALQSVMLAPLIPLYVLHQNFMVAGEKTRYGWREAMHAARDRFTPRFIHRHTDEEVCAWFRELGYGELQCARDRPQPDYVPISFVACVGVDGVRLSTGSSGNDVAASAARFAGPDSI